MLIRLSNTPFGNFLLLFAVIGRFCTVDFSLIMIRMWKSQAHPRVLFLFNVIGGKQNALSAATLYYWAFPTAHLYTTYSCLSVRPPSYLINVEDRYVTNLFDFSCSKVSVSCAIAILWCRGNWQLRSKFTKNGELRQLSLLMLGTGVKEFFEGYQILLLCYIGLPNFCQFMTGYQKFE